MYSLSIVCGLSLLKAKVYVVPLCGLSLLKAKGYVDPLYGLWSCSS